MIQDDQAHWQAQLQKQLETERREKKVDEALLFAQIAIAVIVVGWIAWMIYQISRH